MQEVGSRASLWNQAFFPVLRTALGDPPPPQGTVHRQPRTAIDRHPLVATGHPPLTTTEHRRPLPPTWANHHPPPPTAIRQPPIAG